MRSHLLDFKYTINGDKINIEQYGDGDSEVIFSESVTDFINHSKSINLSSYALDMRDSFSGNYANFASPSYQTKFKRLIDEALVSIARENRHNVQVAKNLTKINRVDLILTQMDDQVITQDKGVALEFFLYDIANEREKEDVEGAKDDEYVTYAYNTCKNRLNDEKLAKIVKYADEYRLGLVSLKELPDEVFTKYSSNFFVKTAQSKFNTIIKEAEEALNGQLDDETKKVIDEKLKDTLNDIALKSERNVQNIKDQLLSKLSQL